MQSSPTLHEEFNAMTTDLYQITMAYAEFRANRHEQTCVFEAFFRKAPFKGRYTIFGGLDEVQDLLRNYKFSDRHIEYLKQKMPHFEPGFWAWLA
jgi:nicotinate phosphoribosyltransferase